jgi:hypothetical protein
MVGKNALSQDSKEFLAFCRERFLVSAIQWREPGVAQQLFGCQLTFYQSLPLARLKAVCTDLENATIETNYRWKAYIYEPASA